MHNSISTIPKIKHLDSGNFFLICGPCAIEGRDMALSIAEKVKKITDDLKIPYIFKGSYRKANRSSTNLLVAAAKTGKYINIKKGQFMGPETMQYAVNKVVESGNPNVGLIERGTTFGYQDLVVDFRGIPQMQDTGQPVIMDCTHSLQTPNQSSGVTGGKPAMIETIAKAAVAVGADGLFLESHPDPSGAKSDGANMLPLDQLQGLLEKLVRVRAAIS